VLGLLGFTELYRCYLCGAGLRRLTKSEKEKRSRKSALQSALLSEADRELVAAGLMKAEVLRTEALSFAALGSWMPMERLTR